MDSGCTAHMTCRDEWMENTTECETEVYLAEEEKITQASSKGDIRAKTKVDNEDQKIIIKNAYTFQN